MKWPPQTFTVLGARMNALTMDDLHEIIRVHVERGEVCIVGSRNLHSLYVERRDERMRQFFDIADYVRIDGMPIAIWASLMGHPVSRNHRVTWVDWLRPLMHEAAGRGWRVFYLGSKPGVAERGAAMLRNEQPGIQLATHHGYFDLTPGSSANEEVLEHIRWFAPNILMVGMGMPRQEQWIYNNWASLPPMTILPCGACIDYVAGQMATPPRWMGRWGVEWVARLWDEPRRLWRRYLVEPWWLMDLFAKDVAGALKARARGNQEGQ